MTYTATYSPDDNKLRLTASSRLDAETYARVKAAGFRWAPRQDLFFAPKWTPGREDLLIELAGEIEDEDKTLTQRAEERADRFETYSEKRGAEAKAARDHVASIADNIPLGQPILVGHHSEKRARKDAERIRSGMDKAVKLWRTSEYWTQRAAGAIYHAKHKELPQVRARRIKTLEAERRSIDRDKVKNLAAQKVYSDPAIFEATRNGEPLLPQLFKTWGIYGLSVEAQSRFNSGELSAADAVAAKLRAFVINIAHIDRWLEHYDNRLTYERALLEEQGATKLLDPKPKTAKAQSPLLNYRAPDGIKMKRLYSSGEFETYQQVEMTKAEYAKIYVDYKATRFVGNNHRVRTAIVKSALVAVFLTDSKVHECPPPDAPKPPAPRAPRPEPMRVTMPAPKAEDPEAADFDAMAKSLKAGVQVVSAPQLFPTPVDIAERMADYADIEPGTRVLEPSAGTGRLIDAAKAEGGEVCAVEIDYRLAEDLARRHGGQVAVVHGDFLDQTPDQLGAFDVVLMNPPFERGSDIKHILHARRFLKPGGRLVAICANGPRQQAALQSIATVWEELPADTFKSQGTGVRTALVVLDGEG